MKCMIYARVSTDKQELSNQLDLCTRWVKDHHPEAVVEVFKDFDTSSKLPIDKRLGLTAMLGSIKKGDLVIVFKLDRIARDIIEMVTIHRLIESKGAKVHSLTEPELQSWMLGIFGALAQKEREDISLRIKAALNARKYRGERRGSIPYGYQVKGNKVRDERNKNEPLILIPNLKEKAMLIEVERLRAMDTSWRSVAEIINQHGYRNRRGSLWTHDQLYKAYQTWCKNQENKSPEINHSILDCAKNS